MKEFQARVGGYWEEVVAKIYFQYQKKLKEAEALDFDDILMLTVQIFQKFPEVLAGYQNLFRYIMVDEYQDTNRAQYLLIKMLSQKFGNICVVGDDWQGIYSWRGADIQNILDFEKDYPNAKVIKLEQNYRSTQNILDAAYGVISKNLNRKDKKIWTDQAGGQMLVSYEADDEKNEAEFITREVAVLMREGKYKYSDFVVLYRTNAQSRTVEEAMLRTSLPYRIIGGVKFYQRKEIKDVVAYLRLISNFNDEISLVRIINEPKRGIGDVTLGKWTKIAKENGSDLISVGLNIGTQNVERGTEELSGVTRSTIRDTRRDVIAKFCEFIKRMNADKDRLPLTDFIQKVFIESGYEKYLLDGTEEGEMRNGKRARTSDGG